MLFIKNNHFIVDAYIIHNIIDQKIFKMNMLIVKIAIKISIICIYLLIII